jgi:rod shape-determining protein MreC
MNKRHYIIATGLVLLLATVCLNLSPDSSARLKRALSSFFIPLFSLQKSVEKAGGALVDYSAPRTVLLTELRDLKQTNQSLRLQLAQNQNLILENTSLRKHLHLPPKSEWNPRLTRIVGRDPANWWRSVLIDLGSKDGVEVNMPVLATHGLVGRIQEVHPHRSRVALIGDPACRISVTIEATGESGILSANGGTVFDPTLVDLLFLPATTEARPGDTLFTSGLGETFPRGIPVGRLLAVEPVPGSLTTTARVKLAVNSSMLNEVWVLTQ